MTTDAQLVLRHDPSKVVALPRSRPTTIGRAANNRLRLASLDGVADHHAVVRFSLSQGWLVCDWQSAAGTFLEGERIRQCRRLSDGDEIQLGPEGPVLVFRLVPAAARPGTAGPAEQTPASGGLPAAAAARSAGPAPLDAAARSQPAATGSTQASAGNTAAPQAAGPPPGQPQPPGAPGGSASASRSALPGSGGLPVPGGGAPLAAAAAGSRPSAAGGPGKRELPAAAAASGTARGRSAATPAGPRGAGTPLNLAGRLIPLEQIRSAHVRSRPLYPHSFSWWVLLCLGGMLLLPVPWLFWSLQIAALVAWILLGSRKEHELVVTLRDGMAHRHTFSNRITALSHRNGIRKAIGQSLEAS